MWKKKKKRRVKILNAELLQTFVCVLNVCDRDLLSPFSKNRSALYNQKVDCQHPAACLWWHLTAWSSGSYRCASLSVAVVAWAPPLALRCAPPRTKLWLRQAGPVHNGNHCNKEEHAMAYGHTETCLFGRTSVVLYRNKVSRYMRAESQSLK